MNHLQRLNVLSEAAQATILKGIFVLGGIAIILAAADHFQTKRIKADPGLRDVK